MHGVIFQTKASNGSLDTSHATKPGAHPQLSDPVSLSPTVGSSVAPILATLGPSLELQAETLKISIPFVNGSTIGLFSYFPPSRLQSIL